MVTDSTRQPQAVGGAVIELVQAQMLVLNQGKPQAVARPALGAGTGAGAQSGKALAMGAGDRAGAALGFNQAKPWPWSPIQLGNPRPWGGQ